MSTNFLAIAGRCERLIQDGDHLVFVGGAALGRPLVGVPLRVEVHKQQLQALKSSVPDLCFETGKFYMHFVIALPGVEAL